MKKLNTFSLKSKNKCAEILTLDTQKPNFSNNSSRRQSTCFLMFLFWSLPTTFPFDLFCLKAYLGLKFEKTILPRVASNPGLPKVFSFSYYCTLFSFLVGKNLRIINKSCLWESCSLNIPLKMTWSLFKLVTFK